jgi:hypothetical protein
VMQFYRQFSKQEVRVNLYHPTWGVTRPLSVKDKVKIKTSRESSGLQKIVIGNEKSP